MTHLSETKDSLTKAAQSWLSGMNASYDPISDAKMIEHNRRVCKLLANPFLVLVLVNLPVVISTSEALRLYLTATEADKLSKDFLKTAANNDISTYYGFAISELVLEYADLVVNLGDKDEHWEAAWQLRTDCIAAKDKRFDVIADFIKNNQHYKEYSNEQASK